MVRLALSSAPGRCLLGLGVAAVLLPASAFAQEHAFGTVTAPAGGIRITAFGGWATGATRKESWTYADGSGGTVRDHVQMRLAGGVAGGAVLQFPVLGPFSLLGGVAWVDRDDAEFSINGGERWVFTGSGNVLVKAGLGMALRDPGDDMAIRRLAAGVFVAPFYAVELPKEIATIQDSDLFDAASHIGVNFGVTGELPFARDRFALQLGLEDYLTFWSGDSLQRLPDWLHDAAGTVVDADPTHQLLLRAGISLRLR